MVDEIDKRRRESQKEWWRDDDCPQPEPDPSKKARLIVQPRIVNVKRGGTAIVRVSVVNRPYGGSIQVELRNLPPKVTAQKVGIPSYRDFSDIQLTALADAPVATEPAVFADADYPKVVTFRSDIFTVNVQ